MTATPGGLLARVVEVGSRVGGSEELTLRRHSLRCSRDTSASSHFCRCCLYAHQFPLTFLYMPPKRAKLWCKTLAQKLWTIQATVVHQTCLSMRQSGPKGYLYSRWFSWPKTWARTNCVK
jgi:hypothetical protein